MTTVTETSEAGTPATPPGVLDRVREPVTVEARYAPPRAGIDPDRSKGWMRRVLPVVLAHRTLLTTSLLMALVAMWSKWRCRR